MINIPVIEITQNKMVMYIGAANARDVNRLAYNDTIRLENIRIPKYAGLNRPLDLRRIKEIEDFLSTPIGRFPNSIIVSIDSEKIKSWKKLEDGSRMSILSIEDSNDVLTVIDGQHRVAALKSAAEDFQVVLTIFIDLNIVEMAEIFARINSTQRTVNPSIAYQLFGYFENRSPKKTAHDIAMLMNTKDASPFFKKLKMMGTRDGYTIGNLSQATFSKYLITLYSGDATKDEYAILKNKKLEDDYKFPLRKYFISDQDNVIISIYWGFFHHVSRTWPKQWDNSNTISILGKTTGYIAFVAVLNEWLRKHESVDLLDDKQLIGLFDNIKSKYDAPENKFISDNYRAGSEGVRKLRDSLFSDFEL